MTTGALIYLVSACASGEEFVAAFRRYADRNGLFVPIAEPIAAGKRGRFAVALESGGVMIEGEAEVVSSARTPSVLYGRIGMTLRFVELDEQSKTVLDELGKARLAMKPPAPSVPPRPAEIPAAPRAVPPPLRGRIDAANALAECVAIGDTAALEIVDKAAALPKAGPRFVVPTILPVAGGRRPANLSPFDGMPQVEPASPAEPVKPQGQLAIAAPELRPPQQTLAHVAPPPPQLAQVTPPQQTLAHVAPPPPQQPPPPLPPVDDEVSDPRATPLKQEDTAPTGVPAIADPIAKAAESAPVRAAPSSARMTPPPVPAVRSSAITPVPTLPAVAKRSTEPRAAAEPEQLAIFDVEISGEPTDLMMIPTLPPDVAPTPAPAPIAPIVEEPTPSGDWTITPAVQMPEGGWKSVVPVPGGHKPGPNGPAASGAPGMGAPPGPPTGDWTIAVDPSADDGWTEPSKVGAEPVPEPASPPPAPAPAPMPAAVARAAKSDSGPGGSARSNERPRIATGSLMAIKPPGAAERHSDVMTAAEPKVQIDPTLIEPLPVLEPLLEPAIDPIGSQPAIEPMAPGAFGPVARGPRISTPPPPPEPRAASSSSNMRLEQALVSLPTYTPPPGYSYEAPASSPQLSAPSSGVGYSPDPGVPFAPAADGMFGPPIDLGNARKRRLVVILISAALVLAVGAIVLAGLSRGDDTEPHATGAAPAPTPKAMAGSAETAAPGGADSGSAATVKPLVMEAAPAPEPRAEEAAPKDCALDVRSAPAGAEIVTAPSAVIGTTPATLTLPCGVEVELTFRKARFYSVERKVTPAVGAKPIAVRLGRQTFSVKVSSVPNGATVTVGGRSLGITPTTIRLPTHETSTLMIEKDGYTADTQRVTPKQNNLSVSVTLSKAPRPRR